MRTNKVFNENLKNNVITNEMLDACVHSVNCRAKNWERKANEINYFYENSRYAFDKYHYEDRAWEERYKYYEMKEKLLSILKPKGIVKQFVKNEVIRYREEEEEAEYKAHLKKKDYFNHNYYITYTSYFDEEMEMKYSGKKDIPKDNDNVKEENIIYCEEGYKIKHWFLDVRTGRKIFNYYLSYDLGCGHTYLVPIKETEISKYDLPIENVESIPVSYGFDTSKLISVQFIKKVLSLIDSENYTLLTDFSDVKTD